MHLFLLVCVLVPALLKADTQCTSKGGVCQYTSNTCSGGIYQSGLCNGPANRKCCLEDAQCIEQSGSCQFTSESCSGGIFWSGKCDGPSTRKCCIPGSQSGDTGCVNTQYGYCQTNTNNCAGFYMSGECAGSSSRQCCIPVSGAPSTGLTTGQVCESFSNNAIRGCDIYGCGEYGASRGSYSHQGSDVKCTMGDDVYAPFPGTLDRRSNPYGSGSCCDTGMVFKGTGTWSDFEVKMFYITPLDADGTSYSQGDVIASHAGLLCGCYNSSMTDHTHFQLYYKGTIIDPTKILTG